MTKKERLQLAEWAKDFALKQGADEISVGVSKSRNIEIGCRERKLENLKESTQNSMALDIYINNRYSSHSTNDLRKDALKKFIEGAIASTKYLSEDPYRSLPDPKFYVKGDLPDLDILDENYEKIDSAQRVKMAEKIETAALDQSDKLISVTSGYNDSFSETVRVTSNGFTGESTRTVFSAGAEATVRDQNGGRPQDWFYARARFQQDLPAPEELGEIAVKKALQKIGQKKIESGQYTMLVDNRSSSRLLGIFRGPMSGRALQQKSSYLDGMLNKKIASEKLTVIDDPFVKKGLGSRHFDGDCLATKRRVLIDKGVLKYFLIDDYYGKKLGMEPTTGSPSNVLFEYGQRSLEEMQKDIKKGILVTGFIGGNSNSTTGDFSFGIVGQLIENGKIIQAVNEMNISGNAKDLWNKLVEMGNDPYPYSSWQRPSMMFEEIHFSGI
jgi:PmbA protein